MRNWWDEAVRAAALALTLLATSAARADGPAGGSAGDVLDRVSVPPPPLWDGGGDLRHPRPSLTADAIAVPTPTAAEAGLAVLCGMAGVRTLRRIARRTAAR